jgi:methyl-accepting chemotaxis protein
MKNLKISSKLLTGFGIAVLFTLAVGITGIYELGNSQKNFDYAVKYHGQPLMEGGSMLEGFHGIKAETRAAIIFSGNAENVQAHEAAADEWFKKFEKAAAEYSPFIVKPEAKALFGETMDAYEKTYKPTVLKILDGAKKGTPVAELAAQMASAKPAGDLISQNVKKIMEMKADLLDKAADDNAAAYKYSLSVILAVIFAGAGISAFLGVYISKMISKPLNETVSMITEMGQGNLSMRLNLERGDEIGVMAKTMDTFASNLQIYVIDIMKQIAGGDLSAKIGAKGGKDEIAAALNGMLESLNTVIGAMKKISEGDLNVNIQPKSDKDEVSYALKNTVESLNVVVGTMKKISEGDLSSKIEPKSDRDAISAALKTTVESLRELIIDDGGRVLQAAADKDLSQRLTSDYKGEFARMKDNINTVVRNLDTALAQVTEAVSQVASASGEISDGAQSLAEGSNEQASSLEEVSSSLEEMSSMTRQNAENSSQAMILASEASAAAKDGDATIRRMANAINQIKQSSDSTAKIVKSIDDIAFQTNLLALNAAVEAARAGEAGKGFAVVAEEVRNLAMRSADAAKDTADMIEESVKNADSGVKITEEVAASLGRIVNRTGKAGDLIAEIAAASKEQAQGIEQVNTAVAQMNKVTQQNAANSEESASAAEELNNQAAELAAMVGSFKLSGYAEKSAAETTARARQKHPHALRQTNRNARTDGSKHQPPPAQIKSARAVTAKELIPLDEEELATIF